MRTQTRPQKSTHIKFLWQKQKPQMFGLAYLQAERVSRRRKPSDDSRWQVSPKVSPSLKELPETAFKSKKNHRFRGENGGFYGCGGRTRTYDLRVMSPTSFQLLYSAIFRWRLILRYYSTKAGICQQVFSSGILSHLRAFCPVPVSWGRLARIRVRGCLHAARGKSRQELSTPMPGSSPCSRIFACCGGMCFKSRVKYVFQKYFRICVKTY